MMDWSLCYDVLRHGINGELASYNVNAFEHCFTMFCLYSNQEGLFQFSFCMTDLD